MFHRFINFFFLLALAASPTLSVSDRRCGTTVSRLWLDVVFVIDNSAGMNMYQVFDTIQSLFSSQVQIGTGYNDPRSTRVGFITYNYNATDVADFYKLQSYNNLLSQLNALRATPLAKTVASYLDTGLNAAVRMINSTAGFRDNYKKMVIVFTSSYGHYRTSPRDIGTYLKSQGVSLVTINTGSDKSTTGYLAQVASDNMSFAMTDGNTTTEILKTMTDTNCFCKYGWTQYSWPIYDRHNRYGTCVIAPRQTVSRQVAHDSCHNTYNSYLVNELDQQKRSFNFEFINRGSKNAVNAFYNGLINLNNVWYWDRLNQSEMIPLDPNSGSPPPRNGCVADMKYSDGTTSWTPVSCSNTFEYICETSTCDTDNYCDSLSK